MQNLLDLKNRYLDVHLTEESNKLKINRSISYRKGGELYEDKPNLSLKEANTEGPGQGASQR